LLGRFAPQAISVPLRGNVPTRLRKLGEHAGVDAIILAAAGLTRLKLDLSAFVVIELDPEWWVPAPGQGALAAQCRADDAQVEAHARLLTDAACADASHWEREFLRVIEGGCSTPFGCHVSGGRAFLGISGERGWLASSTELPNFSEGSRRDEFIRGAVAGCKPIEASDLAAHTLGRAVRAR
jgi:hydroxymethylbilane synthase